MTHVTRLTLTDKDLALILNAVTFAVVCLRIHPATKEDADFQRHAHRGLAALDTFTPVQFADMVKLLQSAADEIEDPSLNERPEGEDEMTEDRDEDPTRAMLEVFDEFRDQHGYRHPMDPRRGSDND